MKNLGGSERQNDDTNLGGKIIAGFWLLFPQRGKSEISRIFALYKECSTQQTGLLREVRTENRVQSVVEKTRTIVRVPNNPCFLSLGNGDFLSFFHAT